MNCHYCKGIDSVEEQISNFCSCDLDDPFVVENVPALVCRLCGDKSYSGATVVKLEKIGNGEVSPSGTKLVRLFDFRDASRAVPHRAEGDRPGSWRF